jgi:serine/threonine-protein kinase
METPKEMPKDAEREMEEAKAGTRRGVAKLSAMRGLGLSVAAPFFAWAGVKSGVAVAAAACAAAGMVASSFYVWKKRDGKLDGWVGLLPFVFGCIGISFFGGVFGPLFVVPTFTLVNATLYAGQADFRVRAPILALTAAPIVVPFLLELAGIVPPSIAFVNDEIHILPRMLHLREAPMLVFLLGTGVFFTTMPLFLVARARAAIRESERRLFLHAWHLRRLVPKEIARS